VDGLQLAYLPRGASGPRSIVLRGYSTPSPEDVGSLYDQARKDGWTVVSMKNDWNRIFAFENFTQFTVQEPELAGAGTK